VIAESYQVISSGGIVCLTGVGQGGASNTASVADVAAAAVLKNVVVVGSVNANKRHWHRGRRDPGPRGQEVAEPPDHPPCEAGEFQGGSEETTDDIKVVIQFAEI